MSKTRMIRVPVRKWGGSTILRIPPVICDMVDLHEGDTAGLYMDRETNQLVVKKVKT